MHTVYNNTHNTCKNKSKHSEMGPVRQKPIPRIVRSAHNVCASHRAQLLHTILQTEALSESMFLFLVTAHPGRPAQRTVKLLLLLLLIILTISSSVSSVILKMSPCSVWAKKKNIDWKTIRNKPTTSTITTQSNTSINHIPTFYK